MSRIHEALERAEQDRKSSRAAAKTDFGTDVTTITQTVAWGHEDDQSIVWPQAPDTERLDRWPYPEWNGTAREVIFEETRQNELVAEQFRTLRSRLQQVQAHRPLKKVLVSSALQAEGKSFVAANLAVVLAKQNNRRVLLIDGDLRCSRLHLVLGAEATPGLSEYLRGQSDYWSVIQRSPLLKSLYFIPAGASADSTELITNGSLAGLISRSETMFDWIVVDSPPMAPISDAASVAQLCDGVLLVIRANSTPADVALKAKTQIREEQWLGAVLNRVSPGDGRYYPYYRSGVGTGSR